MGADDEGWRARGQKGPLIRVPSSYLGKVLDHGKDSASAVHMLLEKLRHGPGYALNWRQLNKPCAKGGLGMSKRAFHDGLKILTETVLERRQGGRRRDGRAAFAREELRPVAGGFTLVPESLIQLHPSKLVAFVAAVLLSPEPRDASQIAGRIGLRSKDAINRLVVDAVAGGYISAAKLDASWIVARPALKPILREVSENDVNEKGDVETDDTENGDTHSKRKTPHREMRDAHSSVKIVSHASDGCAIVEELRSADYTGALAGHLLTPRGLKGYFDLVRQHGVVAHTAILAGLARFAIDGAEPGKVKTWSYFDGLIEDERKAMHMQNTGLRPGDVLGMHRRATTPP